MARFYVKVTSNVATSGGLIVKGDKPWVSDGDLFFGGHRNSLTVSAGNWFAVFAIDDNDKPIDVITTSEIIL